jgi:hypothetical protein
MLICTHCRIYIELELAMSDEMVGAVCPSCGDGILSLVAPERTPLSELESDYEIIERARHIIANSYGGHEENIGGLVWLDSLLRAMAQARAGEIEREAIHGQG